MWTGMATSPVACNTHSRNLTVGSPPSKPGKPSSAPTVAASTWQTLSPRTPMGIAPAAFLGAVVRTACAGHTVSMISSQATGALASGLAYYIKLSPTGLLIDPTFLELKDFVGKAFSGTLGATMAYLRMLHEGYAWSGHYEESLLIPLSSNVAQPDFVFTNGARLAIVEAKGTGKGVSTADDAAKLGYLNQIHTASSRKLAGGSDPTEGYAFGTALNLTHSGAGSPIELTCVHQVFPSTIPSAAGGGGANLGGIQTSDSSQSVLAIKQLNYDTAMLQAGLSRDDIDRVLDGSREDIQLHIGPELARFQLGAHVFTAAVAMPHWLLRDIRDLSLLERLEGSQGSGLPVVSQGRVKGYTFVEFPDHVKVVIREWDAGSWPGPDYLSA